MKSETLILCALFFLSAACLSSPFDLRKEIPIFIGSYSETKGLHVTTLDLKTRRLSDPKAIGNIDNPSFMALDRIEKRLYVVNEAVKGRVSAYQWREKPPHTSLINSVPSLGSYPCYIALSNDVNNLAIANYNTGNLVLYKIGNNGGISAPTQIIQHQGQGPIKPRQQGPHAHWVQWDANEEHIYSVDLGTDEVRAYKFNHLDGSLDKGKTAIRLPSGSGPRHMVFHPNNQLIYILNELANTVVTATKQPDGTFQITQTISTLPKAFTEHNQSAHIYLTSDAKYLYSSNRGHNSIAVFSASQSGELELIQIYSSQGNWPRHFMVLEKSNALLVANQKSNNIALLNISSDGRLSSEKQTIKVNEPAFLIEAFTH